MRDSVPGTPKVVDSVGCVDTLIRLGFVVSGKEVTICGCGGSVNNRGESGSCCPRVVVSGAKEGVTGSVELPIVVWKVFSVVF